MEFELTTFVSPLLYPLDQGSCPIYSTTLCAILLKKILRKYDLGVLGNC